MAVLQAGVVPPARAGEAAGVAVVQAAGVTFREWTLPTPGSHPHDPLATPDGAIWYTGQMASLLGRIDPASGEIKEYPHADPGLRPARPRRRCRRQHLVHRELQGLYRQARPAHGQVQRIPHARSGGARSAHAGVRPGGHALVHRAGRATWSAGWIRAPARSGWCACRRRGRCPTASRSIRAACRSSRSSAPTSSRASTPRRMAIREYALPDPDSRPRRIAIGPDGAVWYHRLARGALGRLDPATGAAREWPSPGGADVRPLRHRLCARRGLVQRVRPCAEHAGAVRPRPRNLPTRGRSPRAAASCAT